MHRDQQGSRQAIHYFEEVMARMNRGSPLSIRALWLANLAHMTIGGFDTRGEPSYFRNDGGSFVDRTAQSRLDSLYGGLNLVTADYDDDDDVDVFVLRGAWLWGLGRHPGSLLRNDGTGRFTDVTEEAGVGDPISSFPTWFWDYDNDGNLDLYVSTNAGAEDTVSLVAASYFGLDIPYELPHLYHGDGHSKFVDVAKSMGLHRFHATMGSNFGELDSDGWLDFYLGTGYPNYEGLMPNVLYRGVEGRRFADVTMAAEVGHLQKGHAVSIADYDADGDQDLFVQMGGAYPGDRCADALFQNPGNGNHCWWGPAPTAPAWERASEST